MMLTLDHLLPPYPPPPLPPSYIVIMTWLKHKVRIINFLRLYFKFHRLYSPSPQLPWHTRSYSKVIICELSNKYMYIIQGKLQIFSGPFQPSSPSLFYLYCLSLYSNTHTCTHTHTHTHTHTGKKHEFTVPVYLNEICIFCHQS